ncbi:MAG: hypothetical protein QOD09_4228 [Bradyrhizobium sp.]|jgi:hypothetical protein|nr:hypothetical protein [Bradyrhizobium sp.]
MRFSMNSYLLGVGTVVGALALGFGGGIVLTNTAIKDTPAGRSRVERAVRAEPAPAAPQVQVTDAKAVPVPRADWPTVQPAAEPVSPMPDNQVHAAAQPKPANDIKPAAEAQEPAKAAEPVRQIDTSKQPEQPVRQADAPKQEEQPVRQADAPKPVEQPVQHPDAAKLAEHPVRQGGAKQVQKESEQRTAEREQRQAEQRRIDREKRNAERERKAKTVIIVRRERPIEEPDQRARPELAFEREEPRPNLFEGLFGRPTGESRD